MIPFSEILTYFLPQGIWPTLSLCLIFYILKAQEKRDHSQSEREKQYQIVIMNLTDSLKDLNEIKSMLSKI